MLTPTELGKTRCGDHKRVVAISDAASSGVIDIAMDGPGYRPENVLRARDAIRHTTTHLLRKAQEPGLAPSKQAARIAVDRMVPPHVSTFRLVHLAQVMA